MGDYSSPAIGPFGETQRRIARLQRQLQEEGRPSGTQTAEALATLTDLVNNLQQEIEDVSASGATWQGPVSNGSSVVTSVLYAAAAPGTVHTGTRVAAWWLSANGLAGTATSSERFKTRIRAVVDDPDFDPFAVLELSIDYWEYIAEVRKRDDPDYEHYVGPHYHVATNMSPIAERAHELGLWQIVVYEREYVPGHEPLLDEGTGAVLRDGIERLKLDENGEPVPFALHDSLFAYLLQIAVKKMREEQLRDRRLLHAVAAATGLDPDTFA